MIEIGKEQMLVWLVGWMIARLTDIAIQQAEPQQIVEAVVQQLYEDPIGASLPEQIVEQQTGIVMELTVESGPEQIV
jgi:hypothetical protein